MEPKSVEEVMTEQLDTVQTVLNVVYEFCVKYSFQVIGGLIVLGLGWYAANIISKWFEKFLVEKKIDVTVSKFVAGALKIAVIGFAVIVALGKFGIEIAPFIAGISVVGFGTSFALQGPLSNYASGITLIFTKPFKVGDIIEVAGVSGEVLDVKLPRTELRALDGELVIIPNKHIIGEVIQNYSGYKRIDTVIGVSYSSDVNKAMDLVKSVLDNEDKIVKEKGYKVGIDEFADSSVNIFIRTWSTQVDYLDTRFAVHEKIFDAFNKNNIEIPFPQRDVNIKREA